MHSTSARKHENIPRPLALIIEKPKGEVYWEVYLTLGGSLQQSEVCA